jgi:DNA-binding beta-propeller fold protein YncE
VFQRARAFSIDPHGNIYVIDGGASKIVKLSPEAELLETAGGYGWTEQAFDQPADVIAPNGLDVYVADYGNHRVQRLDRNLNFVSSFSTREDGTAVVQFGYPRGVAQDRFGALFITDGENKRIVKVNPAGAIELVFGDIAAGEGRLESPSRVRVSSDDRVYVQDLNRIVIFDIFGNFLGTLGNNLFRRLRSFAVEEKTVYVLDSCTVDAFREGGKGEHLRVVLPEGTGHDPCNAIGIDVRGDRIFVLTEHCVSIGKLLLEQIR